MREIGCAIRNKDTGKVYKYVGFEFIRDLIVYGPLLLYLKSFRRILPDDNIFKTQHLFVIMYSASTTLTYMAILCWEGVLLIAVGTHFIIKELPWLITH